MIIGTSHGAGAQFKPAIGAVGPPQAQFLVDKPATPAFGILNGCQIGPAVGGMHEIKQGLGGCMA